MNYYCCHDLIIASELKMMLMPVAKCRADVTIRFGLVPESLPNAITIEPTFQQNKSHLLLKIQTVADFLISNGSHITISPHTQNENLMTAFVYGSCFGALLQQRGIITLHANAIEINDSAILIAGPQKAGKSTLAGAFLLSNHSIISDDVCAIKIINEQPIVLPGTPFIKLTQASLDQLEKNKLSVRIMNTIYDKYRIALNTQYKNKPTPITALFAINPTEVSTMTHYYHTGIQALHTLVKNIYRPNYLKTTFCQKDLLQKLSIIANKITLHQIDRPLSRFSAFELSTLITRLVS